MGHVTIFSVTLKSQEKMKNALFRCQEVQLQMSEGKKLR